MIGELPEHDPAQPPSVHRPPRPRRQDTPGRQLPERRVDRQRRNLPVGNLAQLRRQDVVLAQAVDAQPQWGHFLNQLAPLHVAFHPFVHVLGAHLLELRLPKATVLFENKQTSSTGC